MTPPDARVSAARHRAALASAAARAGMLDIGHLPSMVRTLLVDDLIVLVEALRTHRDTPTPTEAEPTRADRLAEARPTHDRVAEPVTLARLSDAAVCAPDPGVWQLRERDWDRAWDRFCPHRIRWIAEHAVRELAGTDWQPGSPYTDGPAVQRPIVPWLAPEAEGPER